MQEKNSRRQIYVVSLILGIATATFDPQMFRRSLGYNIESDTILPYNPVNRLETIQGKRLLCIFKYKKEIIT